MSGHTPGPWRVEGDTDIRVQGNGGQYIARIYPLVGTDSERDKATEQANARVIAVAPDIVALLSECAEFLDNYRDVEDGNDGRPVPNRAAGLYSRVTELLAQIDREQGGA